MINEHNQLQDNLAAYALNALDPDDIPALETHIKTCASCQATLTEYQRVSAGLLAGLPPRPPRPALKRILAAQLPGNANNVRARFTSWSLAQFAMAGAVVLLLGINLFSLFQVRSLQDQQAEMTRQQETEQTALSILAYAGTQSLPVSGEGLTGSLLLDRDRNAAVLFVWDLPLLTPNQTYQIWLIDPQGKRISAGLFNAVTGRPITIFELSSPKPLSNFTSMGVTIEPRGGSPQPTGPRILSVNF